MKNILLFLTLLFTAANAQDNFILSTLRIGTDSDAGSTLSFKLVNNITVEGSVYPLEEGC